jgi:hypothetical protein
MKEFARICSWLALAMTVGVALISVYNRRIGLESVQSCLLAATVVWFVATPFWMERGNSHPTPPPEPPEP